MPIPEKNDKISRYREHRQLLTRFSTSGAVSPRYAFLSELVMLWLDSKTENADKAWALIVYYMRSASPQLYKKPDNTPKEALIDSPINDKAKDNIKELLDAFLGDDTDPDED